MQYGETSKSIQPSFQPADETNSWKYPLETKKLKLNILPPGGSRDQVLQLNELRCEKVRRRPVSWPCRPIGTRRVKVGGFKTVAPLLWAVLFSWFIGTFNERNNKEAGLNLSYIGCIRNLSDRQAGFVPKVRGNITALIEVIKRPKSPRPGHFSLHRGSSTVRRSRSRRCTAACSTSSTPGSNVWTHPCGNICQW